MQIMVMTEGFLVTVATLCYYPVKLGLVAMVLYVVLLAGNLLREYLNRRQGEHPLIETFRHKLGHVIQDTQQKYLDLELEKLIQQTEHLANTNIERLRFIVRAAPGIGLMGTLIPMGIALAALAQGNMPEMAGMMVNAFNSAIVGLGTGVIAFALALIKESWINNDKNEIRYLAELASIDHTSICSQTPLNSNPLNEAHAIEGSL